MINYEILVDGIVQGVGFRWATKQIADQLGLVGLVRNLPNGKVFIIAQGPKEQMTAFVNQLKQGTNPYCQVDHVYVSQKNIGDFHNFQVTM
ncbi:acylphosphatase [Limosilactobacillus gastricus]|uniref:acylphosphatase n=1 Tax=Limosilactobacillus gastricus TaxID=227942 RepID=UPI0026EED9A3|nr:acylphosphatase [Limosilactobacillus gastricus]